MVKLITEVVKIGNRKNIEEVEIWVPNGTSENELNLKVAAIQAQGKRVIVFRSGRGDLAELTGELLKRNLGLSC